MSGTGGQETAVRDRVVVTCNGSSVHRECLRLARGAKIDFSTLPPRNLAQSGVCGGPTTVRYGSVRRSGSQIAPENHTCPIDRPNYT